MRAARIDANQPEIIKALRSVGCSVQPLHTVGDGVPDLLVGFRSRTVLMEIKDGSKPPSKQALTPDQVQWHSEWRGSPVEVVRNVDDALAAIGAAMQVYGR